MDWTPTLTGIFRGPVRTACVLTRGDYLENFRGSVVDAETLCPMPPAGTPRRAGTEPDIHDVLPTVGCADGDIECLVSELRNRDGPALVPARFGKHVKVPVDIDEQNDMIV